MNSLNRRNFLIAGGAWMGSSVLARAVAERRAKTISIFHTTDLHGRILPTQTYDGVGDVGGMARCVTQIRRWRRDFPDSLLVDLGDVYQGTPAGFHSEGRMMIDLFNRLNYDAWTIGNHDFDWGREVLEGAITLSKSPVLTGNLTVNGSRVGEAGGAWEKVKPWLIREVGGFKVGLIGVTTPGMPFWLPPETMGGVEVFDPRESLARSMAEAREAGAEAIVVMGHMGWRFNEDFANPVSTLLGENEGVDVYLGGHSHQDQGSWMVGNTLCSQASYFGIHCGRVDLTFDLESRKLIDRRAFTVRMDGRFELDPAVIEATQAELKRSDEQLARKVCVVKEALPLRGERSLRTIFCEAFADALKRSGTPVDAVFHGTFGTGDVEPGEKTVADCWTWLPYENLLITAELDAAGLIRMLEEDRGSRSSDRVLWPLEIINETGGGIRELRLGGEALTPGKRYRIALNSYDGQSGGRSMMELRALLELPESRRSMTSIATREALIEWLLEKGVV